MTVYGDRAAVIAALDKMVQEGTILGFQTLHFGKADAEEDRAVIITVPGHLDAAAMRRWLRRLEEPCGSLQGRCSSW